MFEELQSALLFAQLSRLEQEQELRKRRKKKSKKVDMMAQSSFAAGGPALFMEGPKNQFLIGGVERPLPRVKVWKQPKKICDRPSKRVIRLRKGATPRVTSLPAGCP